MTHREHASHAQLALADGDATLCAAALLKVSFSYALLVVLALAMLGHVVRDRTQLLGLVMLMPALQIALCALGWDVILRGRALSRRWLLSIVALGCAAVSFCWQWQPARAPEAGSSDPLRVLQWNTQWGGANVETLEHVLDGIDDQRPDIAFLSEAPNTRALELAWSKRHPGWFISAAADSSKPWYAYNLTVLSRYPVRKQGEWTLVHGHAALFEVGLPARVLRVLMVDLQSSPQVPRSPSIRQAAQLVDTLAPIDLVLGDFNTPAHFLGFDALAAAGGGLRLASLWSGHWRGTWPATMRLPFFDIDHVWVSKRWSIQRSQFFIGYSDHRGQRVDLRWR